MRSWWRMGAMLWDVVVVRGCTRAKLLGMLTMLTMPISFSFLHGYGAPLGDPLRRRSSFRKLVRLFFSPFLPACSVSSQFRILSFLWVSSLILCLRWTAGLIYASPVLAFILLVWWLTPSSSLIGFYRVPIFSSTVDVVYLLKAPCLPSIIPLWCNRFQVLSHFVVVLLLHLHLVLLHKLKQMLSSRSITCYYQQL